MYGGYLQVCKFGKCRLDISDINIYLSVYISKKIFTVTEFCTLRIILFVSFSASDASLMMFHNPDLDINCKNFRTIFRTEHSPAFWWF